MNLAKELVLLLEKAKETGEYFNPYIISGVLDGIEEGYPEADSIVPDELYKWAQRMLSR